MKYISLHIRNWQHKQYLVLYCQPWEAFSLPHYPITHLSQEWNEHSSISGRWQNEDYRPFVELDSQPFHKLSLFAHLRNCCTKDLWCECLRCSSIVVQHRYFSENKPPKEFSQLPKEKIITPFCQAWNCVRAMTKCRFIFPALHEVDSDRLL